MALMATTPSSAARRCRSAQSQIPSLPAGQTPSVARRWGYCRCPKEQSLTTIDERMNARLRHRDSNSFSDDEVVPQLKAAGEWLRQNLLERRAELLAEKTYTGAAR